MVLSGLIVLSNVQCIETVYTNTKTTTSNKISLENTNGTVNIPDKDLKDAIYKKLNLESTANVTVSQLQQITELTLNSKHTANLEGIQYCKNLRNLSIINCEVSDISLLSALTNLETLNLDRNKIEYIYQLSELKNLKTLSLASNYISDVKPLSNIKNNLGENIKYVYQTIELKPVTLKDDKKVVMEIPKVYDINGKLLEQPSKFSDAGDHKIVGNTVVWTNVKEGSTLEIVFENSDETFDVAFCQDVLKPQTNVSLTDVKGHWAEETINNFISKGYINGYENKTFKPDNSITRAEFIKIFNRYFNLNNASGKSFSDTTNHWAKNALGALVENGYMNGYSDNTLRPKNNLTRAEAVSLLSRIK